MCKQTDCCGNCVVHNHYYGSNGDQTGCVPEEICKSIKYGELQRFEGVNSDPNICEWQIGDLGQGFVGGVFGLYQLEDIQPDGLKLWKTLRQSKDATI